MLSYNDRASLLAATRRRRTGHERMAGQGIAGRDSVRPQQLISSLLDNLVVVDHDGVVPGIIRVAALLSPRIRRDSSRELRVLGQILHLDIGPAARVRTPFFAALEVLGDNGFAVAVPALLPGNGRNRQCAESQGHMGCARGDWILKGLEAERVLEVLRLAAYFDFVVRVFLIAVL